MQCSLYCNVWYTVGSLQIGFQLCACSALISYLDVAQVTFQTSWLWLDTEDLDLGLVVKVIHVGIWDAHWIVIFYFFSYCMKLLHNVQQFYK